jgi:D-lyxose ketol-isomerase
MTISEHEAAQKKAAGMIQSAGIQISENEIANIEIVDFGLTDLKKEGAQILTLVQTERISVKIIALFPHQTEPEHWHPRVGDDPGKEETIRVVKGVLYLYIPGANTLKEGKIPKNKDEEYSCRNELVMQVNDQITLTPGTKHWFMAGNEGVVIYSYSTIARDILDKFTDSRVIRIPKNKIKNNGK